MSTRIRLGTSSFTADGWNGAFYPKGMKSAGLGSTVARNVVAEAKPADTASAAQEKQYARRSTVRQRRASPLRGYWIYSIFREDSGQLKPELIKHAQFFVETEEERRSGKHPPYADSFGRTNWVIRNDQLNLAAGLAPGAVGIATYATAVAPAANPVVLAVTLLFSALAVGGRLKNKSASLDEMDYHLLMSLKRIGPVSSIALTNFLNGVEFLVRERGVKNEF